MKKKILLFIATSLIVVSVLAASFIALGGNSLLAKPNKTELARTRIIIPGETDINSLLLDITEQKIRSDSAHSRVPLGDGEEIVSVLNQDLNGDALEEQIIAYRNYHEIDSTIYIALNEFDETNRLYRRTWGVPTAATRPGTVALYSRDLIGDRSVCIILSGMNGQGEHTLTVFKWVGHNAQHQNQSAVNEPASPFIKIVDLQIDGAIRIQETERTQAYQAGYAPGQSFTIAAYGHDPESRNILDQIELIYTYNPQIGMYDRSKVTRVPGSQIEQRRLRELLSGAPGVFEGFINDLWYYVSPEGTIDIKQYIYFDPANREVIFYGEENLQVFRWRNSIPTRYGLYVSSQNISVSTLSRSVNIELESLDSIRIKVFEEVRLKIGVNESWDGSYRRAGPQRTMGNGPRPVQPYIDASYDSSLGRIRFLPDGLYELSSGNTKNTGWYVFFEINDQELLELRPDTKTLTRDAKSEDTSGRMVYRVEKTPKTGASPDIISLSRIRLGSTGIHDLHEGTITLTPVEG